MVACWLINPLRCVVLLYHQYKWISSLNNYWKPLLNHVGIPSLSRLTTCAMNWPTPPFIKKVNSQPSPANFSNRNKYYLCEIMLPEFRANFQLCFIEQYDYWQGRYILQNLYKSTQITFVSINNSSQNWLDLAENWHFWWIVKSVISWRV